MSSHLQTAAGRHGFNPGGLVVALTLLYAGVYCQASEVDRLTFELPYKAGFRPVSDARIASATCRTVNLFLFHTCDFTVVHDAGPNTEIYDMGFGPAPTGSLLLLAHPGAPRRHTTSLSLQSLGTRLAFTAACIVVPLAMVSAVLLPLAQPRRQS